MAVRVVVLRCHDYVEACRIEFESKGALDSVDALKQGALELIEFAMGDDALEDADVDALGPLVDRLLEPQTFAAVKAAFSRLQAEAMKRERVKDLLAPSAKRTAPAVQGTADDAASLATRRLLGLVDGGPPSDDDDDDERLPAVDEAPSPEARPSEAARRGRRAEAAPRLAPARRLRLQVDLETALGELVRVSLDVVASINAAADQRRILDKSRMMPQFARRDIAARSKKASAEALAQRVSATESFLEVGDVVDDSWPDDVRDGYANAEMLLAEDDDDDGPLAQALQTLAATVQADLRERRAFVASRKEATKPKPVLPQRIKPKARRDDYASQHLDFQPTFGALAISGATAGRDSGSKARGLLR